jgi:hypothetical protein
MANIQTAALFGFLGAVAAEILALYKLRQIVPTQVPSLPEIFFSLLGANYSYEPNGRSDRRCLCFRRHAVWNGLSNEHWGFGPSGNRNLDKRHP